MYASFNKGHCNLRNNEKTNIVGGSTEVIMC